MTSSWSTMDPWEKAAQWAQTAPELAADLVLIVLSLVVRKDALMPFVAITVSGVVLGAISMGAAFIMRRQPLT